jgi:hypothetical protein
MAAPTGGVNRHLEITGTMAPEGRHPGRGADAGKGAERAGLGTVGLLSGGRTGIRDATRE